MTGPTVAELDFAALEDLKESLPHLAHKPLAHLPYLRAGQVEAYWLDEIAQDLADESSLAFVFDGQDVLMVWHCVLIRLGTRKQ